MYILFYKDEPIEVHDTMVSVAKKLGITRQSVYGAIKKDSYMNKHYKIQKVTAENFQLVAQILASK